MQGHRVYAKDDEHPGLKEGDYAFDPILKHWVVRPPGCDMGDLGNHEVIEHEDGTITVSPSILVVYSDDQGRDGMWHGYLERGVWRTV